MFKHVGMKIYLLRPSDHSVWDMMSQMVIIMMIFMQMFIIIIDIEVMPQSNRTEGKCARVE